MGEDPNETGRCKEGERKMRDPANTEKVTDLIRGTERERKGCKWHIKCDGLGKRVQEKEVHERTGDKCN